MLSILKKLSALLLIALVLAAPAYAEDEYGIVQYFRYPGTINMKNTGATTIMTTENGTRTLYLFSAHVAISAASSITIPGTMSIGTNSPTCNNILGTTLLTNLLAAGIMLPINFSATTASVPANTAICANVTIAATGTSQTATVTLVGYYQ